MAHLGLSHERRDSSKAKDREALVEIIGLQNTSTLEESSLVLVLGVDRVERLRVIHWLVRSSIVNCNDHRDLPARPNNTHEGRLLGHIPLSESNCSCRLFTILQVMIFVTFDPGNSSRTNPNISALTHHSYLNRCVYITVGNIG